MQKKHSYPFGFWHIIYLILFYVSTTLCLLFIYLAAQSQKWISISSTVVTRILFNGVTMVSRHFLLLVALFFVLNTVYLIRKKE